MARDRRRPRTWANSDDVVKGLVLAADYDAAWHINGPVYGVEITCNHRIVRLAAGDGINKVREVGDVQNGKVVIKVYFDEVNRRISLTGVRGDDY